MQRTFETEIGGRKWTVETGKYAEQAGGSCLVRCGDTAVLVCATVAKAPREFEEFVERYEFSLGPQVRETTGWSAVTYKDNFVLCAARTIVESNIERLVFSKLAEIGLDVTIETNCEV